MNGRKAKVFRKIALLASHATDFTAIYVTRVTKSRVREVPYESDEIRIADGAPEGGVRVFRIDQLSYELREGTAKSVLRFLKRKSAGRSVKPDYGRSPEGVRTPFGRLYPDSRLVDITPRIASRSDHAGEGVSDDGAGEAQPADAHAQA